MVVWYVLTHPVTDAPIMVHWDKELAVQLAKKNGYGLMSVTPEHQDFVPEYTKPEGTRKYDRVEQRAG